jgi:hypothetical protein
MAADEPVHPQNLDCTKIEELKKIAPALDGTGVNIALVTRSITYKGGQPQNDYRPFSAHNCFTGAKFVFHDQGRVSPGISPHATSVCSILFGRDANAFEPNIGSFEYNAVTPNAGAQVYEFWHFLKKHVFTQSPPDADIITASIGNQFQDWWTRGLESLAARNGTIIIAGIGNGYDAYDPPLYPGASANVIGVGMIDSIDADPNNCLTHFALPSPEHSSCGPTEDARAKPDIVAPANALAADAENSSSYIMTGNYSSFSTPVVAGAAALLVQKTKSDPNLIAATGAGANCVIKAILLNSATKLAYWHKGWLAAEDDHKTPLDYTQGAGMLNAAAAYRQLIAGRYQAGFVPTKGWDNNIIEDVPAAYTFNIAQSTDKMITVTLSWNFNYQQTYPFEALPEKDADLRLELWAVDKSNPLRNYLLDYSDSAIDNLEHIYAEADPNFDTYKIIISRKASNEPSAQRYALAWSAGEKPASKNPLLYDLNTDGSVDQTDFAILFENYMASLDSKENYLLGDINSDGLIDLKDIEILLNHPKADDK